MPVFLDLRGERAAAGQVQARIDQLDDTVAQDGCQTIPLDRRVAPRRVAVEQLAVLDEQESLDDQPRHRPEPDIGALGKAGAEDFGAAAIEHAQAGGGLLGIDRERAVIDRRPVTRRQARLALDREPLRAQPFDERGELDVA